MADTDHMTPARTDDDLADQAAKLRGRLARWQSCVTDPSATFAAPAGPAPAAAVAATAAQPVQTVEPAEPAMPAVEADAAVIVPASYLADLRAAAESERDRARELASAVARSQALHAMTLQKRAVRDAQTDTEHRTPNTEHRTPPARRPPLYATERPSGSRAARLAAQVVCALLFSAAGFALVLYFLLQH